MVGLHGNFGERQDILYERRELSALSIDSTATRPMITDVTTHASSLRIALAAVCEFDSS